MSRKKRTRTPAPIKEKKSRLKEIGIIINEQSGKGRVRKNTEFSEEEISLETYEEYQRLSAGDPRMGFDPKSKFVPVEDLIDVLIDENESESENDDESDVNQHASRPARKEMQDLCFYIVDSIPGTVSCFLAPGAAECISGKIAGMKTVLNRLAEQN